jgi:hypothetical protein
MSIQHTTRMGKTYYLYSTSGKAKKSQYYFSTKMEGNPVHVLPEGFEIYENIRGQVFLRRKVTQLITDAELESVRQALRKQAEEWRYKVEVKKDILTIYEASQNFGFLDEMPFLFGQQKEKAKEYLKNSASFQAVLRFILTDPEKRIFRAERYCFRGSIDDWVPIGAAVGAKLPALLDKFIRHLGKESFYELFL